MENLRSKISILTRKGRENSSKFAPSIPAPDQVSTFSTLPLRSYFKKHNVPGFKREYDPKCAPVTTIIMVVNILIEKEEKPEVTTNSRNDVKEVKSVDTNIPATEHVFDDKNQRPTSQVFDDEEHGDVPTVKSDHYVDHTGKADHYETHKGEADHYEATLERTDQTDVDLVLVKEEPATKKAAAAPVAKKAAGEEERFPEKESSGGEEKPAARPATKPVASKEERNSDSNSDDLKDEKPTSEGVKPTAKPAMKEEPPDDNSADGSNDVKKPEAKKAKKLAPGDPMDEEDAVKAIDEAVMHKLDQAKIQVDYQAKPYKHVEKYVKGPEHVALQAEEVQVDVASQEREEKEEVQVDVDATRLSKTMEGSNDEESHPAEDIQTKTDELFDKNVQSDDDQANKVSAVDESKKQKVQLKSDELFENDDHSKENYEVNGSKYDQVKIEELFESIAIFLFFPNYKYRKKRWPGKLDL